MSDFYDRKGRPITLHEWAALREENDPAVWRVDHTQLSTGYVVSTVWLGLNQRFFGRGQPLIFESMVFPCNEEGEITSWSEQDCRRYATEAAAKRGHKELIKKWSSPSVRLDSVAPEE